MRKSTKQRIDTAIEAALYMGPLLVVLAFCMSGCGPANIAGAAIGALAGWPVQQAPAAVTAYDSDPPPGSGHCEPPNSVYAHWVCAP